MRTLVATPDPPLIREAFADGWARSLGPLTNHVKAAYVVACQHPDRLREAVDLGHMAGTWALIAARRETVYADQLAAIVKAWRTLARGADLRTAVTRVRTNLGPDELADPDRDRRKAEAEAAAVVALLLLGNRNNPHWTAFVDALAAGMTVAAAEGVAGAVGIAASQAGVHSVDLQAVYDQALADQTEIQAADTRGRAEVAATTILRGATTDLTRALNAAAAGDMTELDMLGMADLAIGIDGEDQPDDGGNTAAGLYGDQALGQSLLTAAVGWFIQQGAAQVDWVTESGNPCPRCLDYEAQNPWNAQSVPTAPAHPRCACHVMPTDPIHGFDWGQYLR